jgi:hypothetical protein
VKATKAVHTILDAADFAARKHANQRRKGSAAEPYVNHLIEVAELVCGALNEPDVNLVIAALLHDTIEDAGVTREELAERFGAEVADLVAEVTDEKSLPKAERKRLQIENAPKKSVGAQAIQLADKISNLRGIADSPPADWDKQRKREYVTWARNVVDGFTAPNPLLEAEFDKVALRLQEGFADAPNPPRVSHVIDVTDEEIRSGENGHRGRWGRSSAKLVAQSGPRRAEVGHFYANHPSSGRASL